MKNMKKIVLGLLMACALGAVAMQPVWAADNVCEDDAIDQTIRDAVGCTTTKRAEPVATAVIQVVTGLVGVIAVGTMIFGGFMYVSSTGDAQKAYKARNIIIYGVVGLIVALSAFAIVSFVSKGISG